MRIDELERLTTVLTKEIVEEWLWEACVASLFGHGVKKSANSVKYPLPHRRETEIEG